MFGFKIVRRRKEDEIELETFRKTVRLLHDQCLQFDKVLRREMTVSMEMTTFLMSHVEAIHVSVEIYSKNKFSMPSNVFNMDNELGKIHQNVYKLVSTMLDNIALNEKINVVTNIHGDDIDEDTLHQIKRIRDIQAESVNEMNHNIFNMLLALKTIIFIINYDYTRILVGCDIIKEYYSQQKQKLSVSDIEYTISFRKIKFNKGEKNNGLIKSAERTGDGGSGIQPGI